MGKRGDRRRSPCGSVGVAFLALEAAFAARAPLPPTGRAASSINYKPAAWVVGGSGRLLHAGVVRQSHVQRTRKPASRTTRVHQKSDDYDLFMDDDEDDDDYDYDDDYDGDGGEINFDEPRPREYKLKEGQVGVRFINTSGDPDVAVAAYPGEIVTNVAKRAGVKIATACRTGICGTCTTDLEDMNTKDSYRKGFQVVRACVTRVMLLPGHDEMVLDVYRNRSKKGNLNKQLTKNLEGTGAAAQTLPDAMKRFEDGWDDTSAVRAGREAKDKTLFSNATTKAVKSLLNKTGCPDKVGARGQAATSFGASMKEGRGVGMLNPKSQKVIEDKTMYDDLPKMIKRRRPTGGRDLQAKRDRAQQLHLRMRWNRERRKKINKYLDAADRPMATVEEIMMLSPEEVDTRSRFFNQEPRRWEDAAGPPNIPEIEREIAQAKGRVSEGASKARMACYKSVRQVPRYRFFGDPPLDETDEMTVRDFVDDEKQRIDRVEQAEIDRIDWLQDVEIEMNNRYIWKEPRTGRMVSPKKAGTPGSQRKELRKDALPKCESCDGHAWIPCPVCDAQGFLPNAMGDEDLVCPMCGGRCEIECLACDNTGFGPTEVSGAN